MNILRISEAIEILSNHSRQWIVHVHNLGQWQVDDLFESRATLQDVIAATPWLRFDRTGRSKDDSQILADGECIVSFDNEQSARKFYESLPSDDNASEGVRFYAVLIAPDRGIISENT